MDDEILRAANQAGSAAREHCISDFLPVDESGMVTLGVRETIRQLVDSSEITVVWDTDHYDEAVRDCIGTAQGALIQSNGNRGKKLYCTEEEAKDGSYDDFMKTGAIDSLPKAMQYLRQKEREGLPIAEFSRLDNLRKGQYLGNLKIQDIHYFPYDDRSHFKDGDTLQVVGENNSEVSNRLVGERNILMRESIHKRQASVEYDKIMVCVGAEHAAKGIGNAGAGLDEMLERDAKRGKAFRVKSLAISNLPEVAPGIYKEHAFPYRSRDGDELSLAAAIPDVWINYLPNVTPKQFDERVQSRSLASRNYVVTQLCSWRKVFGVSCDPMRDAMDNRLAQSGEHVPGLEFRNELNHMIDCVNSWNWEGAQAQLKSIQGKYSDFKEVREQHEQYLLDEGASEEKAASDSVSYVGTVRSAIYETEIVLNKVVLGSRGDRLQHEQPRSGSGVKGDTRSR